MEFQDKGILLLEMWRNEYIWYVYKIIKKEINLEKNEFES